MGRLRATLARSSLDRELHTHLARASRAVREALRVCQRAARSREASSTPYRQQVQRLARAERLLADIGHLEGSVQSGQDLRREARALCSWLEGRERLAGVSRPSRRGKEYQERLKAVLGFLGQKAQAPAEDPPTARPREPKPMQEDAPARGVLWQQAQALARQKGEGDNEAYVQAIFLRLLRGEGDG